MSAWRLVIVGRRHDAAAVVRRYYPAHAATYTTRGWAMLPSLDRVYVAERGRREPGWQPHYDFDRVVRDGLTTPLTALVGVKGYHSGANASG